MLRLPPLLLLLALATAPTLVSTDADVGRNMFVDRNLDVDGNATLTGELVAPGVRTPIVRTADASLGLVVDGNVESVAVTAAGVAVAGGVTATGAVSGASVAATGAVSGASVTATGAVSGASVTATGAMSAATLTAPIAAINKINDPSFVQIRVNDVAILTMNNEGVHSQLDTEMYGPVFMGDLLNVTGSVYVAEHVNVINDVYCGRAFVGGTMSAVDVTAVSTITGTNVVASSYLAADQILAPGPEIYIDTNEGISPGMAIFAASIEMYQPTEVQAAFQVTGNSILTTVTATAVTADSVTTDALSIDSGQVLYDGVNGVLKIENPKTVGPSSLQLGSAVHGVWELGPRFGGGDFYVTYVDGTGVSLPEFATAWVAASDARLKEIYGYYGAGSLDALALIRPAFFRYLAVNGTRTGDPAGFRRVGVIAQDVLKAVPEAVHEGADGYYSVAMTDLVPLTIASVNELAASVRELREELSSLRNEIADVKAHCCA